MNVFDEYAKWTDTVAKYPPTAEPFYLALGIADEAGEFDSAQLTELPKEGGDVMWYCARYATRVLNVSFSQVVSDTIAADNPEDVQLIVECGVICGVEKKRIRDGEGWSVEALARKQEAAYDALVKIVAHVSIRLAIHGFDLGSILQMNMGKLNARLEAGTIQGDGDNR